MEESENRDAILDCSDQVVLHGYSIGFWSDRDRPLLLILPEQIWRTLAQPSYSRDERSGEVRRLQRPGVLPRMIERLPQLSRLGFRSKVVLVENWTQNTRFVICLNLTD